MIATVEALYLLYCSGIVFWQGTSHEGSIPDSASTAIKVATSGGTVLGQVGFGWLADVLGM